MICRHLFWFVGLVLFSTIAVTENVTSTNSPVELTLDGHSMRGRDFVIDYGVIRNDQPLEFRLGIRNIGSRSLLIKAIGSEHTTAGWVSTNATDAPDSHTLSKDRQDWLVIRVDTKEAGNAVVSLYRAEQLIAIIGISYLLGPPSLSRDIDGRYQTSQSKMMNYSMCTGPVPIGYQLACPVSIRVSNVAPPPNISCGFSTGADCDTRPRKQCDPNAAAGYCAAISLPLEHDILQIAMKLSATFTLKPPNGTLRLSDELEQEQRIRERDARCKTEWDNFVASQTGVPEFLSAPTQINSEHRSAPCAALQTSEIIGTFRGEPADTRWVDVKFGGLRIITSGGPLLVGFTPTPMPPSMVGNQYIDVSAIPLELRIIRDKKVVVGTFLFKASLAGENGGLGLQVPPRIVLPDRPSKGTHTYILQMRTLVAHPQSSVEQVNGTALFAYELSKGTL